MHASDPHRINDDIDRQYDALYETYGKPLEADHWGEYLAVSPSGQTLLGASMHDVALQAAAALGPGVFLYKVGERAVGRWG